MSIWKCDGCKKPCEVKITDEDIVPIDCIIGIFSDWREIKEAAQGSAVQLTTKDTKHKGQ